MLERAVDFHKAPDAVPNDWLALYTLHKLRPGNSYATYGAAFMS